MGAYFKAIGADRSTRSTSNPQTTSSASKCCARVKPETWQSYIEWQILDEIAATLPKRFVDADFKMNQALTGAEELPPRWNRCVRPVDGAR